MAAALRVPLLTRQRIVLAFVVAGVADGVQWLVGPVSGFLLSDAVDVVAMVLLWRLVGFHIVLLPTFMAEVIPVAGMVLPTWLAATAWVVRQRSKEQRRPD